MEIPVTCNNKHKVETIDMKTKADGAHIDRPTALNDWNHTHKTLKIITRFVVYQDI